MVDRQFSDATLAGWYDRFCGRETRDDFAFYLPLVLSATSVLDVGCGTGALLHLAREAGHSGRLCGLDPAPGMLKQARKREDIAWIEGDLASVGWEREFDLIIMTGHAFQVLVGDDELHAALSSIRSALTDSGRFAFETRNPLARAWETWTPENALEASNARGDLARQEPTVEPTAEGDLVRFTVAFTSPLWDGPQLSQSTLRFLDAESLSAFLSGAGLLIDEQFGDWTRTPLTDTSPEIITIARRG